MLLRKNFIVGAPSVGPHGHRQAVAVDIGTPRRRYGAAHCIGAAILGPESAVPKREVWSTSGLEASLQTNPRNCSSKRRREPALPFLCPPPCSGQRAGGGLSVILPYVGFDVGFAMLPALRAAIGQGRVAWRHLMVSPYGVIGCHQLGARFLY